MPAATRLLPALLATALLATAGCASSLRLSPRAAPGQEVVWQQGREVVVAADGWVAMSLHAERAESGMFKLTITVRNLALPRVDVVPTAVTMTGWKGGKAKPLKVMDPLAYVERQARTHALGMMALGAVNGLVAQNDGMRTVVRERVVHPKPDDASRDPQVVTETEQIHDPELAIRMRELRERERKAMEQEAVERRAKLLSELLLGTTLRQGELVSGQVLVEFQEADVYQVSVPVGPRPHLFTLSAAKQ